MNSTVSALAWTLIHFLWEGAVIAAGLAVLLRFVHSSNARYLVSCGAMLLMLVSSTATFLELRGARTAEASATGQITATAVSSAPLQSSRKQGSPAGDYLPWLVYLWMGGVLALSIRTGAGFAVAQRLRHRQTAPLPPEWEARFRALAQRLQIPRSVRACESVIAEVPAVIGWLRPVVLIPASALLGMPAPDVEALLAHELAHVHRHDYLVNLLQTAIETLLFYHPAVWWTGRRIRAERENCCDDLAVAVCGDVLTYARALTNLEQMRFGAPRVAMAANSGSLLARVRRLVRPQDGERNSSGEWITGVAILLSVSAIYAAGYVPAPGPQKPDPTGPPVVTTIHLEDRDTTAGEVSDKIELLDEDAGQGGQTSSAPATKV